ncbi:HEAT repeat domain-containing protein [Anatilimnocola sp. NA78]|uniref:HEAT repeat domain-containing protein n=1 Tax=Anatilimnocola sp. NA78 TaxID=3415683 RepID=UPI003CE47A02
MAINHFRRDSAHKGGGLRRPVPAEVKKAQQVVAAGSSRPPSSPVTRVLLLTILLSTVMLFTASRLGPVWSHALHQRLAEREMAELESLENYQLAAKFDDWLAREHDGLTWTVTALSSSRPGVSYAAEQALLRESDSWRIRNSAETADRMLELARALALSADQLPASRRPNIRRLVEQMATWPIGDKSLAADLIAACDQIVAQLPPASAEELLLAERDSAEDRRLARSIETTTPSTDPPLAPPFENDPREVITPADLPPAEEEPAPKPKKIPKRFFAPRANELPTQPIVPEERVAPPVESTVKKNLNDWVRELADLEVMRLLHHGDYGVRYTAERELDRRGYAKEHLPLAKLLIHPDARERRKLAEQLPRLTNVDPRPWLLQLSEDDDPEVRRAAEGILQAARPGRDTR